MTDEAATGEKASKSSAEQGQQGMVYWYHPDNTGLTLDKVNSIAPKVKTGVIIASLVGIAGGVGMVLNKTKSTALRAFGAIIAAASAYATHKILAISKEFNKPQTRSDLNAGVVEDEFGPLGSFTKNVYNRLSESQKVEFLLADAEGELLGNDKQPELLSNLKNSMASKNAWRDYD